MSEKPSQPVSDEDAMGAALAEIRETRASGDTATQAAPVEATASTEAAGASADTVATDGPPAADPATPAAAAQAPAATEAKTPEQELAEKRAELHRVTSEIGRVNALNRANQEKAQEIATLRQQLATAQKPPATQEEARSRFDTLAEQVKDFPELLSIVQTVGAALKEVEGKVQTTAQAAAQEAVKPLEPLRRQHQDQQNREQEAANAADLTTFEATYPTAVEVIKSDDFRQWLPKQSKAVQWAFYKGETPADAMPVMDAYDAHLRRNGKPPIAHTPPSQPSAAAEPAKPADRLSRAAGIPSRAGNAGRGSLPPQDDFEGSLEFFRSKRQQAERAQRA